MSTVKRNFRGSGRIFENDFLERLTHTNIVAPITIFAVYAVALLYWSFDNQYMGISKTILVFLGGTLAFSLIEYLMHRYLFHLPPTSELNKEIAYKLHGIHHDFPKDKGRLAMPPYVSVFLATLFLFLYNQLMGNAAFSFTAGFVTGYAGYLLVHFMVHIYRVPKNMFRTLWVHHGIHHHKKPDKAFGVTSPLWDYIFRTMP